MTTKLFISRVVVDVSFARGIGSGPHIGHGRVFEFRRKLCIDLGPLRGEIWIINDGFDRTLGHAGSAINAEFGINHGENFTVVFRGIDAIDRADLHTGCVAFAQTFFGDNESHEAISVIRVAGLWAHRGERGWIVNNLTS